MAATVSELQVVVSADTKSAESSLSSFSSKLGSVGGTMATAFGAAAIGGVVALAGGMVAATSAAAGFEAQMSAIKAVSGATGSEMEALQAKALQLGADTSFSASEAAAGIEELIKAGVSVADVLGGGAAAALSLAAAGGLSVAESASIASNAMNVFSLSGSDVGHVADVIAGAANASAIDVHDFGMSLSAAGAVAATVGIGFDDLGTAIAVMGQAGIKGSDAGTSLKTMLLNLTPSSKAQIAVAKELGIVTADGANQFFDATGKAKSLSEIAGVLQTATAGLTEQQKLQALQTLFGTDAIRAAAVMAKAGAAGFDEMAASIGKVTADEVAKERLNNLKGAIEQLGGSISTVAIKMGLQLTPIIREVVDSLTAMVNDAGPIMENFAAMFSEVLASGIAAGKDALRQLGDAWRTVQQVFAGDWSPDASIEPLTLAAGNAATKLKELRDWLQQVVDKASQMGAFDNFASGMETIATEVEHAGAQINAIVGRLDSLNTAASGAGTNAKTYAAGIKVLGVAFELSTISIGAFIDTNLTMIRVGIDVITSIGAVGKAMAALAAGDIPGMKAALEEAKAAWVDAGQTVIKWGSDMTEREKQAFNAIAGAAQTGMTTTAAAVETGMSAATAAVGEGSSGMQQFMEANGVAMSAAAQTGMTGVVTATETGMTEAVAAVEAQGPAAVAAAESMGTGMSGALEAAAPAMAAAAESGASGAVAAVAGQTGAASGAGQSLGEALGSGLEGGIMAYVGRVAAAARSMVAAAVGAGQAEADAHSPSRKTEQLGKDMAEGLEIGLNSSTIGEDMKAKIRDFIEATREYIPTAREISRVEQEIKDIREASQTDALFRGQEMITVDSELLRLKKEQTEEERRLLPIRQDLAAADREVRDIANGSLADRTRLLELETQHKQIRLQSLALEQQLLAAGKDETRKKQIQSQIDALRDQDRALSIEQDRIRTTNDLASTSARMRSLGLGEILASEERNTEAIGRQIAVLGAEKSVFEANEAIIKNATDNEIGYRNRLIAVFNAEGKPLADRITAGRALLEQLHNEGKISDELYNSVKKVTDQHTTAGSAITGMGSAAQAADPKIAAITQQQQALAQSAADVAQKEAQAAGSVSALASSLGKLPSWFTPKGGSSSGSLFSAPSLSTPSYIAPTQSGGYPSGSIVPGQNTVPGGSIIPMSASSSSGGGRQDSMTVQLKIGDQEAGRLFVTGYQVAVQERGFMQQGTL